MKYEAPICDLIKINNLDIIRTSGADEGSDETDSPMIPMPGGLTLG
ncbi:MAG: hypothetical protein IJY23_00255 [Clostridia bacterium]|nr:hypothetical protein [Clostridia bacterium]